MEETRQAEGQIEGAGAQTRGWGCPDPQGGRAAARGGTRRRGSVKPARSESRPLLPPAGWGRPRAEGSPRAPAPREFQARVSARSASPPLGPLGPLGGLAPRAGFPRGRGGAALAPRTPRAALAPRTPSGALAGAGLPLLPLTFCAPRVAAPRGRSGEGGHKRTRTGEGTPPALGARARREFSSPWGSGLSPARQTDETP